MREYVRQLLCAHDWKVTDVECNGVTLSWGAYPVRSFLFHHACEKCGKLKTTSGHIYNDRKLHPEAYGPDGWPVDENGHKLEIVEE